MVAAEACIGTSPAGPRWAVPEPGWKTWNASGPHPHKRPMSDKPDLFLVHQECPNRSSAWKSPTTVEGGFQTDSSVAAHQSNRRCPGAPSSGQVRDDVLEEIKEPRSVI